MMRTEGEANRTQKIGSENSENGPNANCALSITLTGPTQAKNDFKGLPEHVHYTFESDSKKTLGASEIKLAIGRIENVDVVNKTLLESLR